MHNVAQSVMLAVLSLAVGVSVVSTVQSKELSPGKRAPDFSLSNMDGKVQRLSDFKGKYVVLEWTNPGCPFVRNHYNTRNMQGLQAEWSAQDVVWLSIDSSNRSSFDFVEPAQLGEWLKARGAAKSAVPTDPDSR